MKVLAVILLFFVLTLGIYLMAGRGNRAADLLSGSTSESPEPGASVPLVIRMPEFEEDEVPEVSLALADLAKIDRSGWGRFRNPLEEKVPDPDGIGPCPPAYLGGHPAFVIRRYLDRESGDRVWMHEDGAMTLHHYERSKDPGGSKVVGRWIISTAVPTVQRRAAPGSNR